MVIQRTTANVAAGIEHLNGVAAEGIVVAAGGEWASGYSDVSDITAFELAGASYERLEGEFVVSLIDDAWYLFVTGFTAVDLSDSASRVGVWLATAGGELVGFQDDAASPVGSYLPAWASGAVVLPVEPVDLSGGGGAPDTTGSTAGDVYTVVTPGSPAQFTSPAAGGGIEWLDDGANLGTALSPGDGSDPGIARVRYSGPDAPVVATGPAPVMLGVVQAAHRPASTVEATAKWYTSSPIAVGDLVVVVDHNGGLLGTAGGLWVQDATGTLTTGDDVKIDLGSVWWPVVTP